MGGHAKHPGDYGSSHLVSLARGTSAPLLGHGAVAQQGQTHEWQEGLVQHWTGHPLSSCQGVVMLWEPHIPSTHGKEGQHLLEMLQFQNSTSNWRMPPPPMAAAQMAGCPTRQWELGTILQGLQFVHLLTTCPTRSLASSAQFIQKTAVSNLEGALSIFTSSLQRTAPNAT